MNALARGIAAATSDLRLRGYLLSAFAISWIVWIPAGLAQRGWFDLPVTPIVLIAVGSFGPMIAAIIVAARHGGRREVGHLLQRLRFRTMTRRWFATALVLGSVTIAPALLYLLLGGQIERAAVGAHLTVMPLHFLLVATIGGGLDEEVGWRGMAQPRLQDHLSPVPANIILGVIWAAWHLPLWLDPAGAYAAVPIAIYIPVIIGSTLITGYVYNATGGSLLAAIVTHSASNSFDGLRYAILGDAGDDLTWQLVLAATSLGMGLLIANRTGGRLGLPAAPGITGPRGADGLATDAPTDAEADPEPLPALPRPSGP